jgi:hypothetical protein
MAFEKPMEPAWRSFAFLLNSLMVICGRTDSKTYHIRINKQFNICAVKPVYGKGAKLYKIGKGVCLLKH